MFFWVGVDQSTLDSDLPIPWDTKGLRVEEVQERMQDMHLGTDFGK